MFTTQQPNKREKKKTFCQKLHRRKHRISSEFSILWSNLVMLSRPTNRQVLYNSTIFGPQPLVDWSVVHKFSCNFVLQWILFIQVDLSWTWVSLSGITCLVYYKKYSANWFSRRVSQPTEVCQTGKLIGGDRIHNPSIFSKKHRRVDLIKSWPMFHQLLDLGSRQNHQWDTSDCGSFVQNG